MRTSTWTRLFPLVLFDAGLFAFLAFCAGVTNRFRVAGRTFGVDVGTVRARLPGAVVDGLADGGIVVGRTVDAGIVGDSSVVDGLVAAGTDGDGSDGGVGVVGVSSA